MTTSSYMEKLNLTNKNLAFLIVRAAIFALVLIAPNLYSYFDSGGRSADIFNDPDEMFYLNAALKHADLKSQAAVYSEFDQNQSFKEFIWNWRPDQSLLPYLIGHLGKTLNIKPGELGILLDLLITPLSYILAFLLFSKFTKSWLTAEMSGIVLLGLPYVFAAENFLTINFSGYLPFISPDFIYHTCLPVLEAISSQMSYPCVILIFYMLFNINSESSKLGFLLLGACTGLTIYVYFYSWMLCCTVIPILILLLHKKFIDSIKNIFLFSASNLVVSGAGVFLILNNLGQGSGIFTDNQLYRTYWYFPFETGLILGLLSLLYYKSKANNIDLQVKFIATLFISEVILLNLQSLIKVSLQPLSFLFIYITPFMSALLYSIAGNVFYIKEKYKQLFVFFSIALLLLIPVQVFGNFNSTRNSSSDFEQLINFIQSNLSQDQVIAVMTYKKPFQNNTLESDQRPLPNALAALTGNFLLKESWGLDSLLPTAEVTKRELAMGLYYTGTPKLVRRCPDKIEINYGMDLHQWLALDLRRIQFCKYYQENLNRYSACDIINDFKLDYVVWENKLGLTKPDYLSQAGTSVFTSANMEFELIRISKEKMLELFCRH